MYTSKAINYNSNQLTISYKTIHLYVWPCEDHIPVNYNQKQLIVFSSNISLCEVEWFLEEDDDASYYQLSHLRKYGLSSQRVVVVVCCCSCCVVLLLTPTPHSCSDSDCAPDGLSQLFMMIHGGCQHLWLPGQPLLVTHSIHTSYEPNDHSHT